MNIFNKIIGPKQRRYLSLALLVALFSELHFYPIEGGPRLSLGVVALYVIGLIRSDVDISKLALLSGAVIWSERLMTRMVFLNQSFGIAINKVTPAFAFYVLFALVYVFIRLENIKKQLLLCISVMAIVDISCNIIEAVLRHGFTFKLLQILIAAGIFRALLVYTLYYMWQRQSLFIQKQEHQKRYVQLTELAANLETELFYLKKSTNQIESTMHRAYRLYDNLKEEEDFKEEALEIAREIHEIKKDYLRVLSGFKDFYNRMGSIDQLSLFEIMAIVRSSGEKIISERKQKIQITYTVNRDVRLNEYLKIFTVLNNLVDNSIAAIDAEGWIKIDVIYEEGKLKITLKDNGCGISEEHMDIIFFPGFTTKYDLITGIASTGIGLSHVKNIIEEIGGDITLSSKVNEGTVFYLNLPIQ